MGEVISKGQFLAISLPPRLSRSARVERKAVL